jgi:hypothetical protein
MKLRPWVFFVPDGQRIPKGAADIQNGETGPRNVHVLLKKLSKPSSLIATSIFLPMPALGENKLGTFSRIGVQF